MRFENALERSARDLAELLTICFEDYLIPVQFTPSTIAALLRSDSIDLEASILAVEDESVVGAAIICRRGGITRLGGMAVAKPSRGTGIGSALMSRVLEGVKARGERQFMLEVFEHNERARLFYERFGLRTVRRLIGGNLIADPARHTSPLTNITFDELALSIAARGEAATSWEHSPASTLQYMPPTAAFEHEGLRCAVHPLGESLLLVRSIALSGSKDADKLSAVVSGLAALFPGRGVQVPPYFPEPEFGEVFAKTPFTPARVAQIQMHIPQS